MITQLPQTLRYYVGDAPNLQFQLIEPASESEDNTPFQPDVSNWSKMIAVLVPREGSVPIIIAPMFVVDGPSGIIGYNVPGGTMPGDPLPATSLAGSFSQPATYDGQIVCQTTNPAGGHEILTSESFVIIVSPRLAS